jgi:calcium/calmodulin-dependent protein kinase I
MGKGTFSQVKKVVRLNGPDGPEIVVKKVCLNAKAQETHKCFKREIDALKNFAGKRGIMPLITGGFYTDKYAIFLPLFAHTLESYLLHKSGSLLLDEKLDMTSQWLEGLAAIYEEDGMHLDIKPDNLLFRKREAGIEAVIGDFGRYRSTAADTNGLPIAFGIAPPEYYSKREITVQLDVWSLALCLFELFSCQKLHSLENEEVIPWIIKLRPSWIRNYSFFLDTPEFMIDLLDGSRRIHIFMSKILWPMSR